MRKTLLSTLAVGLLLYTSGACLAQESPAAAAKPALTISFSGYNALLEDLGYIGNLVGNPQLAQGLEGMLAAMTQGQGLAGLDKAKPWGAVVSISATDGFLPCVFVPVTDLKQLLQALGPLAGEAEDTGNGVFKLQKAAPPGAMGPPGLPTIYVKEAGGYAFASINPKALDVAPADPLAALGGLNERYDVAVQASIQNIPAPMRQGALQMLKLGAEAGMQRMPDETDENFAIRKGITQRGIDQLETVANDLDRVLLGWTVDASAGSCYLDVEITAVEGSKTAADFAEVKEAKTNFAGFDLPGAAVSANCVGALNDSDVAQAKDSLAQVRTTAIKELKNEGLDGEQLQLATQLLQDLFDVLEKTIENKQLDGGLVLLMNGPGDVTLVVGGVVVEEAKLESIIQRLAKEITKEEPAFEELLKLNAEEYEGVRFHTLDLSMTDPEGAKIFGDTLHVVAGIGQNKAYLAVGSSAVAVLKQVIDKSKAEPEKTVPPLRAMVALTPIINLANEMTEDDEPQKELMRKCAEELAASAGKDRIILTSKPITNGSSTRLEIQGGALKALGMSFMAAFQEARQKAIQFRGAPPGTLPEGEDPFN
jgi:hypothetical protein